MKTVKKSPHSTNAKVNHLIDNLINEVTNANININSVRGPETQEQAQFNELIAYTNQLRGRPLYYNYLGTGRGHGAYVELTDGSVKLDLINGIGIHVLGHAHPLVLKAALHGALSDVVVQGHLEPNVEYAQLSGKLVELAQRKSRLRHAWLSTCGSMANENALKICRQKKTPARMILTFNNAFAGRSTMMAEITDNPAFKQGLPQYNEVLRIPFCNRFESSMCQSSCGKEKALAVLKEHVARHENNISCFVFEPMLGEGGYRVACRDFFIPLF